MMRNEYAAEFELLPVPKWMEKLAEYEPALDVFIDQLEEAREERVEAERHASRRLEIAWSD